MGVGINRRRVLAAAGGLLAVAAGPAWSAEFAAPGAPRPAYVTALEAQYGAPNHDGFGSTVLFGMAKDRAALEKLAEDAYRYFLGDQWEKRGSATWMGPWRLVHQRQGQGEISAELRVISDPEARGSAAMILDAVGSPDEAHAALAAAFDGPEVADLLVYTLGDGEAETGLLIAARRQNGEALCLVFLLD